MIKGVSALERPSLLAPLCRPQNVAPADGRYRVSDDLTCVDDLVSGKVGCFLYHGDCRELLDALPDESIHLIVTSPPYNIGKKYERKRDLDEYLRLQEDVITRCFRVLHKKGSICWQVGNHIVGPSQILPLDIPLHRMFSSLGMQMRNRIVWRFEHGLHCQHRFSGRYEVIAWYTKSDAYQFDVDPIRVRQKYPGKKYFKGPKAGKYSCNPLGKNPGDVWNIPNVKHNHREKTIHPCQFPIELVERLVLSTTRPGQIVLDPFAGVSSSLCAALLNGRKGCGAELVKEYVDVSRTRIEQALQGCLPVRPRTQPIYEPNGEIVARVPEEWENPMPLWK